MGFTAVAMVVGVGLGLAAGGRLSNLGRQPLRSPVALAAGVGLQVVSEVVPLEDAAAVTATVLSYVLLATFAARNFVIQGMFVVLVGLVLNGVVIAVNGGMPVREDAIAAAGIDLKMPAADLDFGAKRHLEGPSDRLVVLADVIPLPPLREVVSFGDLILAVGMADVTFRLLRPARRAKAPRVEAATVVLPAGGQSPLDLREKGPPRVEAGAAGWPPQAS
ncbi:MAG: DUF5317 domain-containing protein [Acidimicrobiia bacterium]|nr:DUF5317 domain-containing protein [Acidimicrobiia bacterium]